MDQEGRFVIKGYERKPAFCSFLPGIAGKRGIPLWCYYVNRGQCMTSFGVSDKDHSIMEFSPAHVAYRDTARMGFRTFIKKDGSYEEVFSEDSQKKNMAIGANDLMISCQNRDGSLMVHVDYFILPGEPVAGLMRRLRITNVSDQVCELELLDGMPQVVPYGVNLFHLKEMTQTAKAWMQVEHVEESMPFFAVRSSIDDTTDVKEMKGGHYYLSVDGRGRMLPVIVDPENVFAWDGSFQRACGFEETPMSELLKRKQNTKNLLPCCFAGFQGVVAPGESISVWSAVGACADMASVRELAKKLSQPGYPEQKHEEALGLVATMCDRILTKTADPVFDAYCRQTYLDNLLRGGYPWKAGKDRVFYLYSRKHGDPERDYNYFRMLPEYASQGNGNFRDICQNRRCDVEFSPFVKDTNIRIFFNLIQIDGYNPLVLEKMSYQLYEAQREQIGIDMMEKGAWKDKPEKEREKLCQETVKFLSGSFTPGLLLRYWEEHSMSEEEADLWLSRILDASDFKVDADFAEGYWTDHWSYSLDLIESYLKIYPEEEEWLLYENECYSYYESRALVLPRNQRYVKTEEGIRQYRALDLETKKMVSHDRLCSAYGEGEEVYSGLMEKLVLLCAVKYAALDPLGIGLEMEGGKPGWYDALNGLPALLGSSVPDSMELLRLLTFLQRVIRKFQRGVLLFWEVDDLLRELCRITKQAGTDTIAFWNGINDKKEAYWKETRFGIDGKKVMMSAAELADILETMEQKLRTGLQRACKDGICATYYSFEVIDYIEKEDGILPTAFRPLRLPDFLEGAVHYMKLDLPHAEKEIMYHRVKESSLFDRKLSMYKVNAPLAGTSFELGRARAFTPGWLENESIWLHMEYKYLLELLKNGFYQEFMDDFHNAGVPFLDSDIYGRSTLENSSFIASSANPDERAWGRGFVARLSGSTAEFLEMWQIMMFGSCPFYQEGEELALRFQPLIPPYLVSGRKEVEARFLGTTRVIYHIGEKTSLLPGRDRISSYQLIYQDGKEVLAAGDHISGSPAEDIRNEKVSIMSVYF